MNNSNIVFECPGEWIDPVAVEHRSAGTSTEAQQPECKNVSTLSKAHISPFIEFCASGSLLKSCKGGIMVQVGGGKRGVIDGFSRAARYRLLLTIARVKRRAELPAFVTLTYPDKFPDPVVSKRHLDIFFKRVVRAFPGCGLIWKLESQERGAPHYHLLVWGSDFDELMIFVPAAWFDVAGGGDLKHLAWHRGECGNGNKHCVQPVRSWKGVWYYAAKYLGKTFDVSGWHGQGMSHHLHRWIQFLPSYATGFQGRL